MTRKELIELLKDVPDDVPVTFIREDFPNDIKGVEVIDCTKPYSEKTAGAGYYYQSYYPESEDVPVFKVAVLL